MNPPVRVLSRPVRCEYACGSCGAVSPKWQGRCDACGAWNSLVEGARRQATRPTAALPAGESIRLQSLARSDESAENCRRSGLVEVDRVLGGGVVTGSLVLLGGDPGIGKSTLALQIAAAVGTPDQPAVYCAGEESAAQVAMRARRLRCCGPEVSVLAETDLDIIATAIASVRPPLAVVDSVQTLMVADASGAPGSPAQVREGVARLLRVAKDSGVPIVLVGHVTKEGAIAGPRTLEHMVDVVLYLEGERHGEHRVLRGVKNRFGSTGEIGLFSMDQDGLRQLPAPGRAFFDETSLTVPGNVLTVCCEGTRPMVVEVQALVASAHGMPRRTASGFDLGRLLLLLAVLERRAAVPASNLDVYVNVVGGLQVVDRALDLAVAVAIHGSVTNRLTTADSVVLGEVGLGGEVRRVARLPARLAEAANLGLRRSVVPEPVLMPHASGISVRGAASLSAALDLVQPAS